MKHKKTRAEDSVKIDKTKNEKRKNWERKNPDENKEKWIKQKKKYIKIRLFLAICFSYAARRLFARSIYHFYHNLANEHCCEELCYLLYFEMKYLEEELFGELLTM